MSIVVTFVIGLVGGYVYRSYRTEINQWVSGKIEAAMNKADAKQDEGEK